MDSANYIFLTAIRETALESAVATAIDEKGWTLALRATESGQVANFLESNPGAHLIASENFKEFELLSPFSPIMISEVTYGDIGRILEEVIAANEDRPVSRKLLHSDVIAFTSAGRRLGTTTYLLNHARYSSIKGLRTLAIDAHIKSPSIARYLNIHQITHQPLQLSPFLSVFEINSLESLITVAEYAESYDRIYIDLGEFVADSSGRGRRLSEEIERWGIESATRINLLSANDDLYIGEDFHRDISEIILSDEVVTGKKQQTLLAGLEESRGRSIALYPRDIRALAKARKGNGFLIEDAPKSLLARAITSHAEHQLRFTHARIPSSDSR